MLFAAIIGSCTECVSTETALLIDGGRLRFLARFREADTLASVSLNHGDVALRTLNTLTHFRVFIKDHVCSLAFATAQDWIENLVSTAHTVVYTRVVNRSRWALTKAQLFIQSEVAKAFEGTSAVTLVSILIQCEALGTTGAHTSALIFVCHQITSAHTTQLWIKILTFKRTNTVSLIFVGNKPSRTDAGA